MLDQINHDGILELRLARPPVNALNLELLTALRDAIEAAPTQGARALLLSGSTGVFTAGLDLPWLLSQDIQTVKATWVAFGDVCRSLAASPLLSAAAIGGHSPAGGAVICLYADYRVMAQGPFRIGLNEVQVGLLVPEPIQYALRRVVGIRQAERMLLAGAMLESEQARAVGLVDELAEPDQVTAQALAWLQDMLKLPTDAQRDTRTIARRDLLESIMDPARMELPRFIAAWQSPQTQAVLQHVVANLGKR